MSDRPDWDRAVFAIGDREITIADVLETARLRGELDDAWAEITKNPDLDAVESDEDAAQASSEQFRSDRDLITAEETEKWLEERGLNEDDFSEYFVRLHARTEAAGDASVSFEEASEDLRDRLRIDALMNGDFDRLARQLAWRFSAPDSLANLGDETTETAALEERFQTEQERILTLDARKETLVAMRLALTRVDLQTLEVESVDAAREALLCLREDGETMAEVANDGGYSLREHRWWVSEVPSDLQARILSASPGEVLGPVERDAEFEIIRLERKIEPSLDDAEVSEKVDRSLIETHFNALAAERVRWIMTMPELYA